MVAGTAAGRRARARDRRPRADSSRRAEHDNDVDYTNLGGRASEILRLAEEQAREVMDRASVDAERLAGGGSARGRLDSRQAAREGNELKSGGLAEIDKVRDPARGRRGHPPRPRQGRVRGPAGGRSSAGRVDASRGRARRPDGPPADLPGHRGAAPHASSARSPTPGSRSRSSARRPWPSSAGPRRRPSQQTSGDADRGDPLPRGVGRPAGGRHPSRPPGSGRRRSSEAEQLKLTSIKEAEDRVEAAKKQAAAISERTQQEFAWRKEQLRRETDLLSQRKQAVLAQLASLSALAQETAPVRSRSRTTWTTSTPSWVTGR